MKDTVMREKLLREIARMVLKAEKRESLSARWVYSAFNSTTSAKFVVKTVKAIARKVPKSAVAVAARRTLIM